MINLAIVGSRSLVGRMERLPPTVRAVLRAKIQVLRLKLEAKVKRDKLSGQVLKVRSGALRRSIASKVEETATTITGKVFSSGDVKYARIHELGGTTPAHVIEPNKAKALAFAMGGKMIFRKRVNHPGSKMPERSYLRSSLREMASEITTELKAAVVQGARQAIGGAAT